MDANFYILNNFPAESWDQTLIIDYSEVLWNYAK